MIMCHNADQSRFDNSELGHRTAGVGKPDLCNFRNIQIVYTPKFNVAAEIPIVRH